MLLTNNPVTASYGDSSGNVSSTQLDQAGQKIGSTDGGGFTGNNQRNDNNLIDQQVDSLGNLTTYEYDDNGNVISINEESFIGATGNLELSQLNGGNGFTINGIDIGVESGFSVDSGGDINSDGIDDIVIGAPKDNDNGSGSVYVVFGSTTGLIPTLELSDLDGNNGFVINGINQGDLFGYSVSIKGDINDDGIDDLMIGARLADPNANSFSGASYVVFGTDSGFDPVLELSQLDGSNGFVINGINADDQIGRSVSIGGDINGDGMDDLIIGASGVDANGGNSGASYVLFGSDEGFAPSFDLSNLDASNGFVINGINVDDFTGYSVSIGGDVNGDGIDDLRKNSLFNETKAILSDALCWEFK